MVYSKSRPAKRKRATLESDPPRDTRMGWRRLSVRQGGHQAPLPTTQMDNQSFPPMPYKLKGLPGTDPETKARDRHATAQSGHNR